MGGFKIKRRVFGKKGIVSEYLPWILIAIAVLAILLTTIILLKGQGSSIIDKLRGIFR